MMDTFFSIAFTQDIKLCVNMAKSFSGEMYQEFVVTYYELNEFKTTRFDNFFDTVDFLKLKLSEEKNK